MKSEASRPDGQVPSLPLVVTGENWNRYFSLHTVRFSLLIFVPKWIKPR
jgi:hypothetical protein